VGDDVLFTHWRPQNIMMTQSGNYETLTHSEGREGEGKGERRKRVNNRTGQSQVSTIPSIDTIYIYIYHISYTTINHLPLQVIHNLISKSNKRSNLSQPWLEYTQPIPKKEGGARCSKRK
jgi:hypothetical protein